MKFGAALIALLLLGAIAGCGGSSPNKRVTGKVTLDGAPVKKGIISLVPTGSGRSAGGEIVDGQYDVGADRGPTVGSYKVSISAPVGTGKFEQDPDTKERWEETKESIPARYNSQTELTMEVTEGENKFDYPLSSK